MDEQQALKRARDIKPITCDICKEELYAPIEKICISLHGSCSIHLENDEKEKQLLTLTEQL